MQSNMHIYQSLDKKNSRCKSNIYEKSPKMLGENKAGTQNLGPVTINVATDVATSCLANWFLYVET